jgi:hypothetical protein
MFSLCGMKPVPSPFQQECPRVLHHGPPAIFDAAQIRRSFPRGPQTVSGTKGYRENCVWSIVVIADALPHLRGGAISAISRRTAGEPMRLKSEIFVSALLRRIFADGGFAAVERKGEEAAGAIFVTQRFRDGTVSLFAPAPQTAFEEGEERGRKFEMRLGAAEEAAVREALQREIRFDPDLWVVEIETDAAIEAYLEIAAAA